MFVVGFPKSGTSTLHTALGKSGFHSAHWHVGDRYIGELMYKSYFRNGDPFPPLLRQFDCITQADVCIDGMNYWPNLDFSIYEAIRKSYPECKFLLNYREPRKIVDSICRWNNLQQRLTDATIPGLPAGFGGKREHLLRWIETHFAALDAYFKDSPNYMTLDVESADAPIRLGAFMGRPIQWWGVANENKKTSAAAG
nr:sulfotransferase [Rhodoblastus acidophilus]